MFDSTKKYFLVFQKVNAKDVQIIPMNLQIYRKHPQKIRSDVIVKITEITVSFRIIVGMVSKETHNWKKVLLFHPDRSCREANQEGLEELVRFLPTVKFVKIDGLNMVFTWSNSCYQFADFTIQTLNGSRITFMIDQPTKLRDESEMGCLERFRINLSVNSGSSLKLHISNILQRLSMDKECFLIKIQDVSANSTIDLMSFEHCIKDYLYFNENICRPETINSLKKIIISRFCIPCGIGTKLAPHHLFACEISRLYQPYICRCGLPLESEEYDMSRKCINPKVSEQFARAEASMKVFDIYPDRKHFNTLTSNDLRVDDLGLMGSKRPNVGCSDDVVSALDVRIIDSYSFCRNCPKDKKKRADIQVFPCGHAIFCSECFEVLINYFLRHPTVHFPCEICAASFSEYEQIPAPKKRIH